MLRPQRPSLARFTTGAQKVLPCKQKRGEGGFWGNTKAYLPILPTFMYARASRPICRPVARQSDRLNEAPVVIGNAKFVPSLRRSVGVTPCVDSSHQR